MFCFLVSLVLPIGIVVDDGTDPDGIESHSLDVVEIVDDSLKVSAAVGVLLKVADRLGAAAQRVSVSQDLVDGLGFPDLGGCCQDSLGLDKDGDGNQQ